MGVPGMRPHGLCGVRSAGSAPIHAVVETTLAYSDRRSPMTDAEYAAWLERFDKETAWLNRFADLWDRFIAAFPDATRYDWANLMEVTKAEAGLGEAA